MKPKAAKLPEDWEYFVRMAVESYDRAQLEALRRGDLAGCFGPKFAGLDVERPLCLPGGRMDLVHRVVTLEPEGGDYGLGRILAEADVHPDDWFLTCHFVDDRVMPGTLMYECCLHTLRVFLLRMGWVGEQDAVVCEPVPEVASQLKCRGQVIESTRVVAYEVVIKELGYRPEPYVIADAIMYADGKRIVEIGNMCLQMSGLTRERIKALWEGASGGAEGDTVPAPAALPAKLYDQANILAFSEGGKPSESFGDGYRDFDDGRFIARLPRPPYAFLDQVAVVDAEPWKMAPGGVIDARYEVPDNAWYFDANRQDVMPFAVLLEVALQPCGWFASYMGSALTSQDDLLFRNLGGTATQHLPVLRTTGGLNTRVSVTNVSASGGMILQSFAFEMTDDAGRTVYDGDTYFGFFSREALANQVGIREAQRHVPFRGRNRPRAVLPVSAGNTLFGQAVQDGRGDRPVCSKRWPGGPRIRAGDSSASTPASGSSRPTFTKTPCGRVPLGLEAFLQVIKAMAAERWGVGGKTEFEAVALGKKHSWTYRGQVIPAGSGSDG